MFPPLKVELFDLNPTSTYILLMDMAPVDKYRYKYQNSTWVRCFEEECSPTRLYVHPDSPNTGSHWMNSVINFYKLKLTNNQLDKQGHVRKYRISNNPCMQISIHVWFATQSLGAIFSGVTSLESYRTTRGHKTLSGCILSKH